MKKKILNVSKAEYLEYEICSYLLRNRILYAYIHAPNENIMDRLFEYMSHCHIPVKYYEDPCTVASGYILCNLTDNTELGMIQHVYITISSNANIPIDEDATQLIIEGDGMVAETDEVIDLDNVPIHLQDSEIRKMFLYAFKVADEEIDIISPWMNRGVVNDSFLALMEAALNRGVKIKIIYGLKPDSNEYNLSRSRRSDIVAELMRTRFKDKSEQLSIRRDNIHYKLVLCDEKYKLEGGYNYLSFVGNYSDSDTRHEGSPFGRDIKEIRFLRKKYFEDI